MVETHKPYETVSYQVSKTVKVYNKYLCVPFFMGCTRILTFAKPARLPNCGQTFPKNFFEKLLP